MNTTHAYQVNGLVVETGDILCTTVGDGDIGIGEFWRFLGRLVPGTVDHVAVYIGPGGRCVEAGRIGVVTFDIRDRMWDAEEMAPQRGGAIDTLHGVAYPLEGKGLSSVQKRRIRAGVASYCLQQAVLQKPYNLNFLDPDTETAFYCSQLAYKSYAPYDVNLNTGLGVPDLPGTDRIIFPQEIWSGCASRQTAEGRPAHSLSRGALSKA